MRRETRRRDLYFLALALLILALWLLGAKAKAERQERQRPLEAKTLHACQPSPEKTEEQRRAGRVIMDAKCDDAGGIYLLTAPAAKR